MFINAIITISALYLISTAMMMKTPNFTSTFIFKIIPLVLGIILGFHMYTIFMM